MTKRELGEIEHLERMIDQAKEKEAIHTRRNDHKKAEKFAAVARSLGAALAKKRTPTLL